LVQIAESKGKPIEAVLMTHGHIDHFSGLKVFENLPRYSSKAAYEFMLKEDAEKGAMGKQYHGDDYPEPRVFPDRYVKDRDILSFGGLDFKFTDLGPGESDADGSWEVVGDSGMHVFIGDLIAQKNHSFFRDGHLREWNAILDRLDETYDEKVKFYFGHGPAPCGKEGIAWQRNYNNAFAAAVALVEDKSEPVSREVQEKVIAHVKKFLPSDAAIFLLDNELERCIPYYWKLMGFNK
jgi:glyoxylase-like metal-dependent hydrolase (beta-lactamase superfamily II)